MKQYVNKFKPYYIYIYNDKKIILYSFLKKPLSLTNINSYCCSLQL